MRQLLINSQMRRLASDRSSCLMVDISYVGVQSHCRGRVSARQKLHGSQQYLVIGGQPLLYADSGIENVHSAVNATLSVRAWSAFLPKSRSVSPIRSSRPIGGR